MNYLTTLLDLCMDDKNRTNNTEGLQQRHRTEFHTCSKTPQNQKGNKPKLSQVMNAGSQADRKNKSTWETSTRSQLPDFECVLEDLLCQEKLRHSFFFVLHLLPFSVLLWALLTAILLRPVERNDRVHGHTTKQERNVLVWHAVLLQVE